jgi:hypothetical protein
MIEQLKCSKYDTCDKITIYFCQLFSPIAGVLNCGSPPPVLISAWMSKLSCSRSLRVLSWFYPVKRAQHHSARECEANAVFAANHLALRKLWGSALHGVPSNSTDLEHLGRYCCVSGRLSERLAQRLFIRSRAPALCGFHLWVIVIRSLSTL